MRKRAASVLLCLSCVWAQQDAIAPARVKAPVIVRPYLAPEIPAVRLSNTARIRSMVRAGLLYLTVQDAIALALENNIDIEVARYNPIIAAWNLERAGAGGALPGVPSGASQAGSVANGQGVAGSQAAAGVSFNGGGTRTSNAVNAQITQVGPVTQVLDPVIQEASTFTHRTTPYPNNVQTITPILVSNTRVQTGSYQEGFLTGGNITVTYTDHYLNENSPTDVLNPSVDANLSFSLAHNLLRGFGVAVNARNITVARINLGTADANFKGQVINTVVDALNSYYALVADYEDVKGKSRAVEVAQTFDRDAREQLRVGTLAPLDVTTADSQLALSQQDIVVSQTNLREQELQLKNLLSRNGLADPVFREARIIPVDRLTMPEKDDLPPLSEMVRTALANRTDLASEKAGLSASEASALGTRNGLLPLSQVFAGESQTGLAGTAAPVIYGPNVLPPDPYFVGGTGNALGQIFRRNFPSRDVGVFLQAPLHNWQAQADYAVDQLQLRQSQLAYQKDLSQAQVDVMNGIVQLRQARARYEAAVRNRILDEQLLDAEQKKFKLGASTPYNVLQQQRDLEVAQASEIAALATYSQARIGLDQTLGTTLEANHISIAEARSGHVARFSAPTAAPPRQP